MFPELEPRPSLFVQRKHSDIHIAVFNPQHDLVPTCSAKNCYYKAVYQVMRDDIYDGEWQQSCLMAQHLGAAVLHVMSVESSVINE